MASELKNKLIAANEETYAVFMAMRYQTHRGKHLLIFIYVPSVSLQELTTQTLKNTNIRVAVDHHHRGLPL